MFELDSLGTVLLLCAIAEVGAAEAMVAIDGEECNAGAMIEGDDAIDAAMLLCTCFFEYPTSSVGLFHFLIDY